VGEKGKAFMRERLVKKRELGRFIPGSRRKPLGGAEVHGLWGARWSLEVFGIRDRWGRGVEALGLQELGREGKQNVQRIECGSRGGKEMRRLSKEVLLKKDMGKKGV